MASIIIALDLPSAEASLSLVDRLGDSVTWYKVGPPLYTRAGASVVQALKERGKSVFLDLKFHDIPNTVALAVEAATEVGVDMLSVHTLGGATMLRAARQAVVEDGPLIVGITLLTSFTPADVEQVWGKELFSLREEVSRLAALASETALNGVVTSVLEAEALKRRHGADFVVVTPGIRSAGEDTGDQIRTATPAEAVRAGSDFLVVGRPVLEAADPVAAVERILDQMQGAVVA
jgi:orotidine-5'-phosphate decarboxylase